MFEDLIKQIEQQVAKKPHVVIGISGYGGSGKSTLAERICDHFNIPHSQILCMDYMHSEVNSDNAELFEDHDWPMILKLLRGIHDGKSIKFTSRGYWGHTKDIAIPQSKVMVFEGVRLLRTEAMPYFDVSVWVDCPVELATRRAKERDRQQGQDEEHMRLWDTLWVPQNDEYVHQVHPEKLASFVYKEYE
jgi:uridine kinase